MQLGQYDLDTGKLRLRFLVDGDASTVVGHGDGAVRMQCDDDGIAESCQCLIHGIVDDLPQAMHKPLGIRGTDVHARTLAYRVEPFENGKILCAVILFSHVPLPLVVNPYHDKKLPQG